MEAPCNQHFLRIVKQIIRKIHINCLLKTPLFLMKKFKNIYFIICMTYLINEFHFKVHIPLIAKFKQSFFVF